jgi:hypothetical protein
MIADLRQDGSRLFQKLEQVSGGRIPTASRGSGSRDGRGYRFKKIVMPGLVPGIHVFFFFRRSDDRYKDVDGRNKSGHDE